MTELSVASSTDKRRRFLFRAAMVATLVLIAHGASVVAPFQFDDIHQIRDNPVFDDLSNLGRFFTDPWIGSSTGHVAYFRPLLFISFVVDRIAGGGSPIPFRVTSMLLLILYALIAAKFSRRVLERLLPDAPTTKISTASFATACLVAAHPILNEVVLLATSRSSLLMATFGLAALTLFLKEKTGIRDEVLMFFFTVAACLTKETAVTLLPLALFLAATDSRRPWRARAVSAWPIVVPVLAYFLFYETVFQWMKIPGPPVPVLRSLAEAQAGTDFPARGGMALVGLGSLLFRPFSMSLVHTLPEIKGFGRVLGFSVWPMTFACAGFLLRRSPGQRLAGFALLWFTIALFPSLALVSLNTPFAEHRAVLAVIAPFVALAYAFCSLPSAALRRGIGIGVLLLLAGATAAQTLSWRTPSLLWRHETGSQPASPRAWGFLADALYESNDLEGARTAIQRALALAPNHPIYLARAGMIELLAGRLDVARRYFDHGLAIEQQLPSLHLGEAERLSRLGRIDEAEFHVRKAVVIDSRSSIAWNALGNVLTLKERRAEAIEAYREAIRLDPENSVARENLRRALAGI